MSHTRHVRNSGVHCMSCVHHAHVTHAMVSAVVCASHQLEKHHDACDHHVFIEHVTGNSGEMEQWTCLFSITPEDKLHRCGNDDQSGNMSDSHIPHWHTHTHTHTHTHMHTHTHVPRCVSIHVCTYICVDMYIMHVVGGMNELMLHLLSVSMMKFTGAKSHV